MKDLRKFIATTIREYLNENISNVDNNIIEYLETKNIFIDSYLKSGTKGHVYSLKNGNCLKITSYKVDSHYNYYIDMIGKENNYLVNIINAFKYDNYLFVEMEKLKPIQFNRWKKFDKVNSTEEWVKSVFLTFLNYENKKQNLEDAIIVFLNENENIDDIKQTHEIEDDDIERILWDLDIMFEAQIELNNKYGFYLQDFHSQNIMESDLTNDYKLIDFI